ncbi:MAG TPA: restriction endonuclease [Blastocatellia bacterium]|nr:restriction endonuclease [Blastocatellia bacterium]
MENPFLMTPEEFEIAVRRFLQKEGRALKDFRVQHLEKIQGYDGDYIIDVTARFEALGVDFLVLIECKRYTSDPVEREQVQALNQKKISTGAHKAMLFSTSTFRNGAIEFAKANRIALVQVSAKRMSYATKSWLPELSAEFVSPESTSLVDFLFDGNIPDEPERNPSSEDTALKIFSITVLNQRLDYLRILSARGYDVNQSEIENLRKEIKEEEDELRRMQESKI